MGKPEELPVEVMAIINLTPDSFSGDGILGAPDPGRDFGARARDGGRGGDGGCGGQDPVETAVSKALAAVDSGATWVDLGPESSRPGAKPVTQDTELERLVPVLKLLSQERAKRRLRQRGESFRISVDTMKPAVMAIALAEGADMINDVNGFRAPGAWQVAVNAPGICLVHMSGSPSTMQQQAFYPESAGGVVGAVRRFFGERLEEGCAYGLDPARVVLDPGIGFGKTLEHNLGLLRAIAELGRPGWPLPDQEYPILIGASRKSMIGELTGKAVEERCAGSIGAALAAFETGAAILRVHDVAETIDALRVYHACHRDSALPYRSSTGGLLASAAR